MDNEWSPLQKNLELYEKIVADFISAGYEPEQIAPFLDEGLRLEFEHCSYSEPGYFTHIRCFINQLGKASMWCIVADSHGVVEEEVVADAYSEITGEFTLADIFKYHWGF